MRRTEQELKEYAEKEAETIVIRTYENGNSSDTRRKTTKKEKAIITSVIYGGLLAVRNGADMNSVKHACEFIGDLQIPSMNGYDSIYQPLVNFKF